MNSLSTNTLEDPDSRNYSSSDNAEKPAVLHLFCGRIAAGKSTLAKSLARRHKAVLISEDSWLATAYDQAITNFDDYRVYSRRLRKIVSPHCVELLQLGLNVVLDFPGNTPNCRQWLKSIADQADARHVLHYLTAPKDQCWEQLHQRLEKQGESTNRIALQEFESVNRYFVAPDVSEGFNVEINR